MSDDDLQLETSDSGLLRSADVARTDQTGAVLLALVDAVAKVYVGGKAPAVAAPSNVTAMGPLQFEAIFDPTDNGQLRAVNKKLDDNRTNLKLAVVTQRTVKDANDHVTAIPVDSDINSEKFISNALDVPARVSSETDGIAYRRPIPYAISILQSDSSGPNGPTFVSTKTVQVLLPNRSPISVIPYDTGLFTKSEHDVAFLDGSLTKIHSSRPSEVLGFAKILPDAAKEIVSIPAQILQLKIDTTKNETALLEAQKQLLDAQKALRDAQASSTMNGDSK